MRYCSKQAAAILAPTSAVIMISWIKAVPGIESLKLSKYSIKT